MELLQPLKGPTMKKILASLITGVLAASAFAATPVAQPLTQATPAHKAIAAKTKHGKKAEHPAIAKTKHSSVTPAAKKSVVIN
jgi:hypothetical protein